MAQDSSPPGASKKEEAILYGPDGEKIGADTPKPGLLDATGIEVSRANIITAKDQESEEEAPKDPEAGLDTPEAGKEDEEIQAKIEPLDHAIAEMIQMRPAISNTELGEMFDINRNVIAKRRKRPVFIRYMIFLRKPGLEILKSAEKKAAQRLNEALDATKVVQRKDPKDGKTKLAREPDFWVRIAASQAITGLTIGNKHVIEVQGKTEIPGVPPDEVGDLASGLVKTYQEAEIVEEKEDRKRLTPGKEGS